jgi:hypothetical protein
MRTIEEQKNLIEILNSEHQSIWARIGSPDNPLADKELVRKFNKLTLKLRVERDTLDQMEHPEEYERRQKAALKLRELEIEDEE